MSWDHVRSRCPVLMACHGCHAQLPSGRCAHQPFDDGIHSATTRLKKSLSRPWWPYGKEWLPVYNKQDKGNVKQLRSVKRSLSRPWWPYGKAWLSIYTKQDKETCSASLVALTSHLKFFWLHDTLVITISWHYFFPVATHGMTSGVKETRNASRKGLYNRVCKSVTPRSPRLLISWTLLFGLNVTLTLVFNFAVLLSYRVIYVFLAQSLAVP
jgi:hypothetical protein